MEPLENWSDAKHVAAVQEDFEQYFSQYNEVDNMIQETLGGLEELDVPSGLNFQEKKAHLRGHSRKISGTAIFGFADHTRELSLNGILNNLNPGNFASNVLLENHRTEKALEMKSSELGSDMKSISPEEILRDLDDAQWKFPKIQPDIFREEDEDEEDDQKDNEGGYYLPTKEVNSYKFPPSSNPSQANSQVYKDKNYQANYKYFEDDKQDLTDTKEEPPYKYMPLEVQQPKISMKRPLEPLQQLPQLELLLPPPSPPTLSNTSPDLHSLPEPSSPSPLRRFELHSSPIRPLSTEFLKPSQFFSDDNFHSSPSFDRYFEKPSGFDRSTGFEKSPGYDDISYSPVKYDYDFNSSINEPDIDATLTLISPLKNPLTPTKSNVTLEWSPIISPSAKASKDVKRHIQLSSLRRKVNKTSLLPPGELDRYWEGPDEEKNFSCTFKNCGKKFTRRYNVRSHIQTHLSDRPFACSYCPKRFVRQHDLNRHVKGHLEVRYCRCPCGKEFARLDAMKKHRERNICIGSISKEMGDSKELNDELQED